MPHFARKMFSVEPSPFLASHTRRRPAVISTSWLAPLLVAAGVAGLIAVSHAGLSNDQEVAWLSRLANSGDAGAQAQLGLAYRDGRYGLDADPHAGLYWLKAAAKGGDAYAADAVGDAYAQGQGTAPDTTTAEQWWSRAAAAGNAHAQARLGKALLADGKTDQARDWLRKAADQGEAQAQAALRDLTSQEQASVADARHGENSLAAEARRMDSPSLGLAAAVWEALGHGAPAGVRISRLRDQAQSGDPVAQYQLAELYSTGNWGVKRDDAKALHWLKTSAEAGNTVAMETLSKVYRDGRMGVTPDPRQADRWHARAEHTSTSAASA